VREFSLRENHVVGSVRLRKYSGVHAGESLADFGETGIVKVEGAFTDREASRMRDVVWNELRHRHEIERDRPETWNRQTPTGLRATKRSQAFAPICGPVIAGLLDSLFGGGRWRRPKHYGNVLVTMPNADVWRVPHKVWHPDFEPTLPPDRLTAVKLWALFDDVDPGGGGTPQLAGSHLAFSRYLARTRERAYKRAKFGFLNSHPWLKALTRDDGDPDRNERFMSAGTEIDGVKLRVVECVGKSGDVYVTHPWVFHSIAMNSSARPRLMRSVVITRSILDLSATRL
jgi:Phytanoyl-CoA dioxygenase (PhyH)